MGKDYNGFVARPATSERALKWLRAALARQNLDKDLWIDLTWHSFRVFMPDCAFQAQIPRDLRQYLGNWMAESTADVYTREKRNVVCSIWEQVTSCVDKLDTKGYRAAKIDLVYDDPQDAQQAAAPPDTSSPTSAAKPPPAGAIGPDMESPRGGKVTTSPSNLDKIEALNKYQQDTDSFILCVR